MLRLLTCLDRGGGCFPELVKSAHEFGPGLEILTPDGHWRGLTTKLHLLQDCLERAVGDRELVILCDAFDCVVVRRLADIEDAFRRFGAEIVMAAETNLAPNPTLLPRYPRAPTRYQFLNSGVLMGFGGALRRALKDMGVERLPETLNDQGVWTDWWLLNQRRIALDYRCELFGCLYGAEADYEYRAGGVVNRLTRTGPFILHGNGRADMGAVRVWLQRQRATRFRFGRRGEEWHKPV